MNKPEHDRANHRVSSRALRRKRQVTRALFRPEVALLEHRELLTALPTITALVASATTAVAGHPVTLVATVSDLSAGGGIPTGGTVTFSDAAGTIGTATLADGSAALTTTDLAAGTVTVSASYGGTSAFAASTTGTIVTAAGDGTTGAKGDGGPATAAELDSPGGMAFDTAGDLFFGDQSNNVVREVVAATGDIITVAGNGKAGYTGDNGPATAAELKDPRDVAVDSAGDLFIADVNNNVIREVVKATGNIVTIAGNGTNGFSGNNGPATKAELSVPRGVAVDSAGNVFFADNGNNEVREVVAATGDIIDVAGDGTAGYKGDNGPATAAELNSPNTVAVDSAGDVFIADSTNYAIREVVASTGDIITAAGNGKDAYKGDGGPATAAELDGARGIAVDSIGDLFIGEDGDDKIREVVKATGDIITVAGTGVDGDTGDDGPATAAELDGAARVAVDPAGQVFISGDNSSSVIREFTPAVTMVISPSPTPTPTPTSPTPTPTPTKPVTHTPTSTHGSTQTFTPLPAAAPLPPGYARTPPKIVRIATRMIDRKPEIIIQLDQGILSNVAENKALYSVETPEAEHIAVSKVVYQAKTHTIKLVLRKQPMVKGDVLLTIAANGIVNMLGQKLEDANAADSATLVSEIDLP